MHSQRSSLKIAFRCVQHRCVCRVKLSSQGCGSIKVENVSSRVAHPSLENVRRKAKERREQANREISLDNRVSATQSTHPDTGSTKFQVGRSSSEVDRLGIREVTGQRANSEVSVRHATESTQSRSGSTQWQVS